MSVFVQGNVNNILVTAIHSDEKLGTWWAVGTEKGYVEIRTTKTGLMRVGGFKKGQHPYFTISSSNQPIRNK